MMTDIEPKELQARSLAHLGERVGVRQLLSFDGARKLIPPIR